MSKFKVYISDYDYGDIDIERSVLEPIGAEVVGLQCRTGEGLGELAADADGIIQQYARITRPTIEKLAKCKIIARYGIGVDILDVDAAYERGMVVTNVPDYCLDEVADQAMAFTLMLMRNLPFYDARVRAGSYRWQDWRAPIQRYRDSTFGMLGFGRIAQNLARKMGAVGFKLKAYDPYVSEGVMRTYGVEKAGLDEVFRTATAVCVLTPHTPETHHIVNEERLRLMGKGSYLVAVSRGKCVDNQALYKALSEGWIAGAGLDDPEEEPMKLDNWSPDMNPLFTLDNCFFTPHTAYVTQQALDECRRIAATNVRLVLEGKKPNDIVRPSRKG